MADLADLIRDRPTTEITTAIARSATAKTVTVNLRGGTVTAPCLTTYQPAKGDIVALASLAPGNWLALGSLGTTSEAGPPAPPPTTSGTLTLNAVTTHVYTDTRPASGRHLAQGTKGDSTYHTGLYYADAIRGTLADIHATAAHLWLRRTTDGPADATAVYAYTHTDTQPTPTAPDDTHAEPIGTLTPGEAAWLPLTTTQLAALNSDATGIALGGPTAPYLTYTTPTTTPQTATLRITWET